jgi:SAM-dependent methyltransferase
MVSTGRAETWKTTSAQYVTEQAAYQPEKTRRYLLPIIEALGVRTVVDVGCGIGAMVDTLCRAGYDAYGVDLIDTEPLWARAGRTRDRFIIIDPERFQMPFPDLSVDFIFSFGVIEHVGTSNGHSARRSDYHAVRRQWVRELFRTARIEGHLLLGGPNRNFPVDAAHGPDARASILERLLFARTGLSIHRVWGDHFLWSYGDLRWYLDGLPCCIEPLSVKGLLEFSRAPRPLRGLARAWVHNLPKPLLGTGLNPWMMALVRKTGA